MRKSMKRFFLTLSALLLVCTAAFADDDDIEVQDEIQDEPAMNVRGDKFIKIDLAGAFPLNFGDIFQDGESQLEIGGTGAIGFYYFLTGDIAIGADLGFGYQPTIGSNIFNYIPLTIGAIFQPTLAHFEFPISLGIGAAVENYLSETYFPGLILKAGAGAFYRITPAWSLGINATWMGMPHWYKNPKYNFFGHFLDAGLTIRYHFF